MSSISPTAERLWSIMRAMAEKAAPDVSEIVAAVYRAESRRVLATLIRVLRDFDLAEEALHEAFRAAVEQWPS
jgi:RNA polymerase sigma-70 factor (ECF subfamily)